MNVNEILAYDTLHNQNGVSFAEVVNLIDREIKENHARIVRQGDTLFIMKTLPRGVCEFHSFNADSKDNFIQNVIVFLHLLDRLHYKKAITPFASPVLEHIAQKYLADKFNIQVHRAQDGYLMEVSY